MLTQPLQIASQNRRIHAELCLGKLRAGFDLPAQRRGFPDVRRIERRVRDSDEEVGASAHCAPMRQAMHVANGRCGLHDADGIEIENRLRLRLVARFRIVTGEREHIDDAERCSADQLALQGNAIAVAAGELKDRLQTLFPQQVRGDGGIEMGPRAGAVGDIHRIGQLLDEEEPPRERRHVGAGDPRRRFVLQGHPQRQPLPLHAAVERAVGPADDAVGGQE